MYFESGLTTIWLLLKAVRTCLSFARLDSILKFHANETFSSISVFPVMYKTIVVTLRWTLRFAVRWNIPHSHFYSVPEFNVSLKNIQRSFEDFKVRSKKWKKLSKTCRHFLPRSAVLWHLIFVYGAITSLLPFQFLVVVLFCYVVPGSFSNNWQVHGLYSNYDSITSVKTVRPFKLYIQIPHHDFICCD